MSLDLDKLENVVELAGRAWQARCPACAEDGQDRTGEHLRIYPDGKFGCCVHSGDREHRKRIFALAGDHSRRGIKVRAATVRVGGVVQAGILGRLGRVFTSPATVGQDADASDGGNEVQARVETTRTARTGVAKSSDDSSEVISPLIEETRTLRTPFQNPRVYVEESPSGEDNTIATLKEFGRGVRSVRSSGEREGLEPDAEEPRRMPFLKPDGTLVIPFSSPARYLWWKGGQTAEATRAELLAS